MPITQLQIAVIFFIFAKFNLSFVFYLILSLVLHTQTRESLLTVCITCALCLRSAGVGDWTGQNPLQSGKGGPLYDYQLQVGQVPSPTHRQCFTHFHHLMHTNYWQLLACYIEQITVSACTA